MPDTVPPAPSPAPASDAPKSDANQSASNLTEAQLARYLATPNETPAEQTTAPAAKQENAPEPSAAETEQPAPDAKPEGNEADKAEGTEGDADDVLSQKSSLDQKTKERIQKRIDKEVGKRKQLEARLQEMEAKLTQAADSKDKPQAPATTLPSSSPLADIDTIEALAAKQQEAKSAMRWAEDLLDHDQVDQGLEVNGQVWTKEQLKAVAKGARLHLEDHIPARMQFLQQRHQAQQAAYAKFPFLKDKTSEEYAMAQVTYKEMPWLRNVPNADWIVGLGVKGWKAMLAEEAAAKKASEAPPKPKIDPPKPPSSQTAVSAGATSRAPVGTTKPVSAGEHFKGKGGVNGGELAAFLANQERSRNSA